MKIKGTRPLAKLGLPGYARILVRISSKPATMAELMEEGYVASFGAAHDVLAAFHRFQRIYIHDWKMIPRRPLRAVWKYGSGDDAAAPLFRPAKRSRYRAGKAYVPKLYGPMKLSMLCFEDLLSALESKKTMAQLMQATEIAQTTIRHTLVALKPILIVGMSGRSRTYQLRDCAAGKRAQPSAAVQEAPRVASVFDLGRAANDVRQAA